MPCPWIRHCKKTRDSSAVFLCQIQAGQQEFRGNMTGVSGREFSQMVSTLSCVIPTGCVQNCVISCVGAHAHEVKHLLKSACFFVLTIDRHKDSTGLIDRCGTAAPECAFHQKSLKRRFVSRVNEFNGFLMEPEKHDRRLSDGTGQHQGGYHAIGLRQQCRRTCTLSYSLHEKIEETRCLGENPPCRTGHIDVQPSRRERAGPFHSPFQPIPLPGRMWSGKIHPCHFTLSLCVKQSRSGVGASHSCFARSRHGASSGGE